MKKLISALIMFFVLFSQSFALSPIIKVFPNSEEFLKVEGSVCESATDWCNTISIVNGKLWASTMMYCEDIYGKKWQEKWTCTKYVDGYDYWLDQTQMCTMEYAPVCAEVQVQCIKAPCYPITQTFWNTCSAWKNKILYNWECNSSVNMNLYNKYKNWQDEIQQKLEKIPSETLVKVVE